LQREDLPRKKMLRHRKHNQNQMRSAQRLCQVANLLQQKCLSPAEAREQSTTCRSRKLALTAHAKKQPLYGTAPLLPAAGSSSRRVIWLPLWSRLTPFWGAAPFSHHRGARDGPRINGRYPSHYHYCWPMAGADRLVPTVPRGSTCPRKIGQRTQELNGPAPQTNVHRHILPTVCREGGAN
jgi:hypothetical protein